MQQQGHQPADDLLQKHVLTAPVAGLVEVPEEADGGRTELHLLLGGGEGLVSASAGPQAPSLCHPPVPVSWALALPDTGTWGGMGRLVRKSPQGTWVVRGGGGRGMVQG